MSVDAQAASAAASRICLRTMETLIDQTNNIRVGRHLIPLLLKARISYSYHGRQESKRSTRVTD